MTVRQPPSPGSVPPGSCAKAPRTSRDTASVSASGRVRCAGTRPGSGAAVATGATTQDSVSRAAVSQTLPSAGSSSLGQPGSSAATA